MTRLLNSFEFVGAEWCADRSADPAFASSDLPMQIHAALRGETLAAPAAESARPARQFFPRRAHILIADDEPRIRLALRSCLEAEGYRVQEAADGYEALDVIVRCAPDLMILDLAMPTLDGMRTLSELQSVHGQLKPRVIVLTAWGSEPALLKAIGLGAELFLEKPIDPETLRRAVSVVLSRDDSKDEQTPRPNLRGPVS